ncbi:hypothetical protein [Brevundimonas denitrificans]|nr:hypothetical protein [Brevundimonas denitrificans]
MFSFILNGGRHLVQDTGAALEIAPANLLSHLSVWGPVVLTVLFWVVLFAAGKVSL